MPKVMPKDDGQMEYWLDLYNELNNSEHPERLLKQYVAQLQQKVSTMELFQILSSVYNALIEANNTLLAEYIRELYGYGAGRKCFDKSSTVGYRTDGEAFYRSLKLQETDTNAIAEKVNLETIENYCLKECVNYREIKPVYDMLLELLYGVTDSRWTECKRRIHDRMAEIETKTTILNQGAELVLEKNVEFEVKGVQAGGTGVAINKGGDK